MVGDVLRHDAQAESLRSNLLSKLGPKGPEDKMTYAEWWRRRAVPSTWRGLDGTQGRSRTRAAPATKVLLALNAA